MNSIYLQVYKKFIGAGIALILILLIGTIGYRIIGGEQTSILNCLYMTIITISTIGYGEVVDLSSSPGGRVFTIFIVMFGVGTLFYIITNFTAFVVEGELKDSFRRRRMEKKAEHLTDHYIVCGLGRVGFYILDELSAVGKSFVAIDMERTHIERFTSEYPDQVFFEKDATDEDTLLLAGVRKAKGVFAVAGDDNQNLVITLTAKQIQPHVRVVSRCTDIKNSAKMKKAGADAVISPSYIGGLRMASEMIRPSVVSFLDAMLRDKEKNLRIEEIIVPDKFSGRSIADLNLKAYSNSLLLAVRTKESWQYNPSGEYIVEPGHVLVFMTMREELEKLKNIFL